MTRLIPEWLTTSQADIHHWSLRVKAITGMSVKALARSAAASWRFSDHRTTNRSQVSRPTFPGGTVTPRCGVLRITSGQGTIPGFSETVADLLSYLGATVFLLKASDVEGLYQGLRQDADILFLADDDRYLALNVKNGGYGENDVATAYGFTAALHAMAGDLADRDVLLLGCGRVGAHALNALKKRGARVFLYDRDIARAKALAGEAHGVLHDKAEIRAFPLIFDTTDEGSWLHPGDLHEDVLIAAPGLPLSLDTEYAIITGNRVFHDPLQTGTVVMLYMAMLAKDKRPTTK
jgi:pyrrolysine biosynthesis protein PylD